MSGSLFQNCTWLLSALTKMCLVEFQLFKWESFGRISVFHTHFSVLSPFQCYCFISIPTFNSHFNVLFPFQRFIPFQCFIPISAFYPHFSVLSLFQRFIPISVFYSHFTVLSSFQCFMVLSPFQPLHSVSVSAIQFRRFIPTPTWRYELVLSLHETLKTVFDVSRKGPSSER